MKTLLILLGLAMADSQWMMAEGQNFGVTFFATNSAEVLSGMPRWWIAPAKCRALGTNTAVVPPEVLMTWQQVRDCTSTNQAAYDAWRASQRAPLDANLARIQQLYTQIDQGRTLCSNIDQTTATIEASLASGTNTQAQVVVRIRQLNGAVHDHNTINAGVLELLQRLGPVLRGIYRPEEDPD